jgi:hypothetical protein
MVDSSSQREKKGGSQSWLQRVKTVRKRWGRRQIAQVSYPEGTSRNSAVVFGGQAHATASTAHSGQAHADDDSRRTTAQ